MTASGLKAKPECCEGVIHLPIYVPPPSTVTFVICGPNFVSVLCLSPRVGCPEEIPDGAQEQRGESGEVPGRAEEAAQEEPGQQEPLQVWREGDAGESLARVFFFFLHECHINTQIFTTV